MIAMTMLLYRLRYFRVESLLLQQTFLKEIRMMFGARGFICPLWDKELAEFHHYLEKILHFMILKKLSME